MPTAIRRLPQTSLVEVHFNRQSASLVCSRFSFCPNHSDQAHPELSFRASRRAGGAKIPHKKPASWIPGVVLKNDPKLTEPHLRNTKSTLPNLKIEEVTPGLHGFTKVPLPNLD